jgi:hypothetical protein
MLLPVKLLVASRLNMVMRSTSVVLRLEQLQCSSLSTMANTVGFE